MTHYCQQDELYASENTCPPGESLTLEGANALVNRLRDTDWWEANVPVVRFIEVVKLRRNGSGSVGGWDPDRGAGVIEMAPVHMTERLICHELAHVLAKAQWGGSGHNPGFARMYLIIVWLVMGSEAYKALYDAFVRDGIDFA